MTPDIAGSSTYILTERVRNKVEKGNSLMKDTFSSNMKKKSFLKCTVDLSEHKKLERHTLPASIKETFHNSPISFEDELLPEII